MLGEVFVYGKAEQLNSKIRIKFGIRRKKRGDIEHSHIPEFILFSFL